MSQWITFVPLPPAPRTYRWAVISRKTQAALGTVSWYGPWRQYGFFPSPNTVFEEVCLRDIAAFCESETRARKEVRALIREAINE